MEIEYGQYNVMVVKDKESDVLTAWINNPGYEGILVEAGTLSEVFKNLSGVLEAWQKFKSS